MKFDPLAPIQMINADTERVERLLVSFDGFIKNQGEGIIRTMLSEQEDWLDVYPFLSIYDEMTMEEIYDAVSLYQPYELLYELSGKTRKHDDILEDLNTILPSIFLNNSKITQFEIALYRLLQEDKIEYCCIFKEGPFYENETQYIRTYFKDVLQKIELVDETELPIIFDKINPTTAFVTDPAFVFGYLEDVYGNEDPELEKKMIIILNNTETVELVGPSFVYTDAYKESMTYVNTHKNYGVCSMFNFQLDESQSDILDEEDTEDDE